MDDKITERAHYIEEKVTQRFHKLFHKDKKYKLMKNKYHPYDSEIGDNIVLEIKEREGKYHRQMMTEGILLDAKKYNTLLAINKTAYVISVINNCAYVHLVKKQYKQSPRERIKNSWTNQTKDTDVIYLPISDSVYFFEVDY
jgi:hypothetical protein